MFIVPIDKISTIADLNKGSTAVTAATGAAGDLPFQSLFENAVNDVKQTNADVNSELVKLATGQSDDLHNLTIASQKASLSVQLLVELRDKALDAYNEIMRMNV